MSRSTRGASRGSFLWLFVEADAVETVRPIRNAQLLTYGKLLDRPLGRVIQFPALKA